MFIFVKSSYLIQSSYCLYFW